MNQVDTILNCRWVIPVEPQGAVYDHYSIVLNQGKILDLLPQTLTASKYTSSNTIELSTHAVIPGFVNAHTHSPMTLFRGLADDLPLMKWLNDYIWPAERKWLNEEFIKEGTEIAIGEMLQCGTTCFNEHFFFPDVIANVTIENHMRGCIGPTIINFPTNWSRDENEGFEKFIRIYQESVPHPLLTWSLAPHSPYGTTDTILRKIADFSQGNDLRIHMHVHETEQEVKESIAQYGKRPLQRLYELGLLTKRMQCVHMTEVNDEDLALLKLTQANMTHCPESNLKLASGYCEAQRMLDENINVALGTDGAASNNDLDMLSEVRTAALIGKTVAKNATALSAPTVLRMATLNGAKAMGLEDQIGSIEIGKYGDVIAIDLERLNTMPVYNPISQIVYSATHQQITDVWVAGKHLVKNNILQYMDIEKLLANTRKWRKRISNS